MTGIPVKRGNVDTETDMHTGKCPVNMKAEIRIVVFKAGNARLLAVGRRTWSRFSFTDLKGNQFCQYLDLELSASGPRRQYISGV